MAARRAPSLEALFIAAVTLFGFGSGTRPIADNSMFLHMRTGIEIAAGNGIPRHDPYSFTAHGHSWVVQSWFAELTYGVAHRIGGFSLVSLEQGLLMALLALLVAVLARAGTPLRTALAAVVAVGIGSAFWSPRPLLYGLLASSAFPAVFRPRHSWEIFRETSDMHHYIDGGVMDNLPLDAVARFLDRASHASSGAIVRRPKIGDQEVPHLIFTADNAVRALSACKAVTTATDIGTDIR